MIALLFVVIASKFICVVNGYQEFNVSGIRTILAQQNEQVIIKCSTNTPLRYCGFVHPTGKRYSFSGHELKDGSCSIKKKVTFNDTGIWRCNIGVESIGFEIMQKINLRITNKLAAVEPNISTVHGNTVTVRCVITVKMPISYCRFEPPNGVPFSIDPSYSVEKPLEGKYYYPHNMSLNRGDCAVTIKKVKYPDVGTWTCGAGMVDGEEYTDTITISVGGLYTMSTASITGVSFGILAILAVLVGLFVIGWRKRFMLGVHPPRRDSIALGEMESSCAVPDSPRTPIRECVPSIVVESPSDSGISPLMQH